MRRNGDFALFEHVLFSQKSCVEMNLRVQPSGKALGMAEYLLIVLLLGRAVNASPIKKPSGVWDYGLDSKAAETTLV